MCSSLSKQQSCHVQKGHSFVAEKSAVAPNKNIMNRQIINIQNAEFKQEKTAHFVTYLFS